MNMKQFRNALWIAAPMAAMSLFTSCTKEEEEMMPVTAEEVQLANSEAAMDAQFQNVDNIVFESMLMATNEGGRFEMSNCALVNHNADTRTLTVDFGEGCADAQGHVRAGKIMVTYQGKIFQDGFTQDISLENFSIDGVALEGTRSWTYTGGMSEQMPSFAITLEDGKVTWPDGTFATREVNQVHTIVFGANSGNNEFQVSGTASGIRRNGQEYTSNISQPLVFSAGCMSEGIYVPVSGVQQIAADGKDTMTLNYGDGACDKIANVTVGGRSQDVTIGQ